MKKVILFCTVVLSSLSLLAQPKNTVGKYPGRTQFFAEVGGPGILFSANIDTRFNTSSLGWGGRIGLGFYTGKNIITTMGCTITIIPSPWSLFHCK